MGNVALKNAMFLWNRNGNAKMVDHQESGRFPEFKSSACACYSNWSKLTKNEKIINIMAEALAAIVRDGADGRSVVEAIYSVPEVRKILAEDMLR